MTSIIYSFAIPTQLLWRCFPQPYI